MNLPRGSGEVEVPKAWLDGVVDDDGRVERIPYELCVLIALWRREVYVQDAGRWRDPDEDLPGAFPGPGCFAGWPPPWLVCPTN